MRPQRQRDLAAVGVHAPRHAADKVPVPLFTGVGDGLPQPLLQRCTAGIVLIIPPRQLFRPIPGKAHRHLFCRHTPHPLSPSIVQDRSAPVKGGQWNFPLDFLRPPCYHICRKQPHICLRGGVKVPTGGIPRFGESPRAPSAWRGQQIRWEAGADGNSPDEREMDSRRIHAPREPQHAQLPGCGVMPWRSCLSP